MILKASDRYKADDEQTSWLLQGDRAVNDSSPRAERGFNRERLTLIVTVAAYTVAAITFVHALRYPTDLQCTKKLSTWSPMIDQVSLEWRPLIPYDDTARYTGSPTEAIESLWYELWAFGAISIPIEQLTQLNKSANEKNWTMLSSTQGSGVKAYFEGFHHLHCVDLIRQYTYRNQYDYSALPAWQMSPEGLLDHVEHCLEILRIEISCIGDTTPYAISIDSNGSELVHANTTYKCRRWHDLTQWAGEHVIEPYDPVEEIRKHHKTNH